VCPSKSGFRKSVLSTSLFFLSAEVRVTSVLMCGGYAREICCSGISAYWYVVIPSAYSLSNFLHFDTAAAGSSFLDC